MIGESISHYEIIDKLGEGGMGVVYKALDTRLSRVVALKFLSPQLTSDERVKTRFIQEAKAASSLDHPNISVIHEIGDTDDGRSFICMGYYEGETLKERIERDPPDIETAVNIALQVSRGLQCAHEAGIIHRDIKPANIILTDRGEVKIVDFGLAKLVSETAITETGKRGGTLAYMSPEQLHGSKVDIRTDLYSLGVVFYEMLTGKRPFYDDHQAALMYSIVNEDPAPPSIINHAVPKELDEIVLQLLCKNPDKRYNSAEVLVHRLESIVNGSGTESQLSSFGFRKVITRPKAALTALLLLIVITALSIPDSRHTIFQMIAPSVVAGDIHLVVLPFENIGDDPENRPFSAGLMETLTSSLTLLQPEDLSYWVVSASEVRERNIRSARDALKEFNATFAVYGSVQRQSDRIRLTLNLVETSTSRQIQSSVLSVSVDSLHRLQDEAISTVAGMLNIGINTRADLSLTAGGTSNSKSYEHYLEGRGFLQDYQVIENIDRAISLFEKAIDLDPRFSMAHAGLGEAYWRKYEITRDSEWVDHAIEYGQRSKELDASFPAVHVALGMIQHGTGRYDEAVNSFRRAMELDPVDADAHRGLARSYEQLGNIDGAEETFKRAIRLRPSYWAGYNELGRFYLRQGKFREAIPQFEKVTELIPNSSVGFSNLGGTYYFLEEFQRAIEMFNKAVAIEPHYGVYSNLGTLYYYESNFEEAAKMYENALDMRDHDYRVWGFYASALRWSGEDSSRVNRYYRKALTMAQEEKSVNPRDASLLTSIAAYYVRLGKNSEARRYLDNALEIAPDNLDVTGFAGIIFEQLGDRDRAKSLITNALERGYPLWEIENDPDLREFRNDVSYERFIRDFTEGEGI